MEYIIARDGRQEGPFTQAQVFEMRRTGVLSAQTLAWTKGAPAWRPLGEFPEFVLPDVPPPLPISVDVPPPLPTAAVVPPLPFGGPQPAVKASRKLPSVTYGALASTLFWVLCLNSATKGAMGQVAASTQDAQSMTDFASAASAMDPSTAAAAGVFAFLLYISWAVAGVCAFMGIRRHGWKHLPTVIPAGVQAFTILLYACNAL